MGTVQTTVALTLAEAAMVLDPPMAEQQLRAIVTALGWQQEGWRQRATRGHPFPTYDAEQILRLHAALVPFLH